MIQAIDPFEVQRPLGKGGRGTVYLAGDPRTGARGAVKTVSGENSDAGQTLKRFAKEVEILARREHPNIVRALRPCRWPAGPQGRREHAQLAGVRTP